jgi:4-oxalocrotonate tautomerase
MIMPYAAACRGSGRFNLVADNGDSERHFILCNTMEIKMPEVFVHAVEGRSVDQKRALAKDITDAVVKHYGGSAESVMVDFIDFAKHNKSKAGVLFSDK